MVLQNKYKQRASAKARARLPQGSTRTTSAATPGGPAFPSLATDVEGADDEGSGEDDSDSDSEADLQRRNARTRALPSNAHRYDLGEAEEEDDDASRAVREQEEEQLRDARSRLAARAELRDCDDGDAAGLQAHDREALRLPGQRKRAPLPAASTRAISPGGLDEHISLATMIKQEHANRQLRKRFQVAAEPLSTSSRRFAKAARPNSEATAAGSNVHADEVDGFLSEINGLSLIGRPPGSTSGQADSSSLAQRASSTVPGPTDPFLDNVLDDPSGTFARRRT